LAGLAPLGVAVRIPHVDPDPDVTARVSVIIPDLDSPVVDRAVSALCGGRGPRPLEILVVGRDGPGRLAGEDRARLVPTARPVFPGAARNLGVNQARGDLFYFLDADCVPEPDCLACHLARHAAGETVVGGAVLWDTSNYWTLADNVSAFHACARDVAAGPRRFLPTLNLSVRRAAFEAVGPMDPDMPRGEDMEWTIRAAAAGHRPYFEPAARVWHRPNRSTPHALLDHAYQSGRWMVSVRRRHPDAFGRPAWLYRRPVVTLLAPLIAATALASIYRPGRVGWRHPATLPAVYAAKLAWCLGAARPIPPAVGASTGRRETSGARDQ